MGAGYERGRQEGRDHRNQAGGASRVRPRAKAQPRLPGRAGGGERGRDVQAAEGQDRRRPRPGRGCPSERRGRLARALRVRARGRKDDRRGHGLDERDVLQRDQDRPPRARGRRQDHGRLVDDPEVHLPRLPGRGIPAPDVRVGAARRPDQGVQQEVLHGLPREGVRVRGAPRRPAGADLPRHRLLQEDQRHARAPGGRLRAGRAVADDVDAAAHGGRAGAVRRRGVHDPLPRDRICRARRLSRSACARRSRSGSSASAARTSP